MVKRKIVYQISDDGFIIERFPVSVNEHGEILDELEEGLNIITVDIPQSTFHKACWNGLKWIEGATQEEIDELTKFEQSPPTTDQRVDELESVVNMIILGGI